MNRLVYRRSEKDAQSRLRTFVSESEFNRDVSILAKRAQKAYTITFPSTVKKAQGEAFEKND